MRVLILLAAVVLVFALLGWISFNNSPGRASVNIESDRIRQDADRAMQTGGELLQKAGDKVSSDRVAPSTSGEPVPATR